MVGPVTDYAAPVDDMSFVLRHVVDYPSLAEYGEFAHADLDTVVAVLRECGRFMSEVLAPLNRSGDQIGARRNDDGSVTTPEGFAAAYRAYVDAGWGAVPFPPEFGGGGFPWVVGVAMQEMLTSANMGFSLCPLLTQGAIDALLHHGSDELREVYLRNMVTGEWTGTMNLTEPQAGSDVGALTTRAVPAGDGTWRISGQKIFITYGEHDMADNIVHLVLARTPGAPAGTKGISCFVVPKYLVGPDGSLGEHNDVSCVSIEHKLGIHASPTCVLSYGDRGEGAVGYLIGDENTGMRTMFTMMNNARLSVGLEGLALGERAYQQAVAYAGERVQGRAVGLEADQPSPIIEHPDVRRMVMTMRAGIEALRCLILLNGSAIDRAAHHPDEAERARWNDLVALLTPLSKGWGTDLGVELTSLNVQIHGGMGYIEETGAAQHFRDARIAPIYEGTNGIQAADLVGRKLGLGGGQVVADLLAQMRDTAVELEEGGERLEPIGASLRVAVNQLETVGKWLAQHGASDPRALFGGSVPYLRMFGLTVGGWLLGRSALVAARLLEPAERSGSAEFDAAFLEAKIVTARFYAANLLSGVAGLVGAATAGSEDLYAIRTDYLVG